MHLEQRDAPRALEALRRCLAIDPTFANGWHFVGVAELFLGNHAAAEDAFRRQLVIVPGHEDSARWLGRMGR
jgi:cytochrome c-type biogenesis protein CcmH/NrfG